MAPGRVALRLLPALIFGPVCAVALADAIGYALVYDCKAESTEIIVEHHHDWSNATRDARWKMISTDKQILGTENKYSYVRAVRRQDGRQLFQVPAPALSYIWISPDSRFIVGVSNIKLWNPLQVVVLNANGDVLLARAVENSTFPGVAESVTNWVKWYKEPAPEIAIEASGKVFVLRVEGNSGVERVFQFRDPP
jgi:hypothetical protein